jgi:hypothetical protein
LGQAVDAPAAQLPAPSQALWVSIPALQESVPQWVVIG